MNSITVTGRLGKDPEQRHTQGGKTVTNFSLAVDDGWGENKKTIWLGIVTWEKTAELASKYLKKGSKVLISGALQIRQYESGDQTKTAVEIVARQLEFLDSKSSSNEDSAPPARSAPKPNRRPAPEYNDDDIPF